MKIKVILFFNKAILGLQIIVTMAMLSLLHKLSLRYSIARRVLTRLIRYLHPRTEEIKLSANIKSSTPNSSNSQSNSSTSKANKRRNKHDKGDHSTSNGILVPKNIEITLEAERINDLDLIQLQYYTEYQWLLDFSLCAFFVYALTELYYFLFPRTQDFNLSLVWCTLVILFSL